MPGLVGVAHLVLRVKDWRASARWYQDVLGLEPRKAEGVTGFSHPDARFVVLLKATDEELAPSSVPTQHLDHLALHVPSEDELESWRDELARKGIETEIERSGFGSSITLYDPDGLEVELFVPKSGGVLDASVPMREVLLSEP
jgi:catechol-2,3-dioxygenase